MAPPLVSIIVPVLHDTDALARLLPTLDAGHDIEIIVVNGGPSDSGFEVLAAERPDIRWLSSPAGRGCQMNAGARSASGRWLLFLHADTRLAAQWLDELQRADADPAFVGGSFRFRLDSAAYSARLIERGVAWRVRWLDLAYGDQALFVRREVFQALGGYREWPLMEDVEFVRRLRRAGLLYHSSLAAVTSARRWERDGWWRRSARNVALQALYFLGASPAWLARRYQRTEPTRRQALVVMARAPSDPRGKTRLTRGLGGDPVDLKRAILMDTLAVAARVQGADVFVAFEPSRAAEEFRSLTRGAWLLLPQQGQSLGDRMHHVFSELFGRGYGSVVMIGSDLPTLPAAYIEGAFRHLRGRKDAIAVGPAADGGYYLMGLTRSVPQLFDSVPWSTPDVLAATLRAASNAELAVSMVPEWYDVDEVEDLRRALNERADATHLRAWASAHPEFTPALQPSRPARKGRWPMTFWRTPHRGTRRRSSTSAGRTLG